MPPIRSFIAIELPTETRSGLERITGTLKASAGDVRWVKTGDIHLTLKFLGDVEEERIPEIGGCIEQCVAGNNARLPSRCAVWVHSPATTALR